MTATNFPELPPTIITRRCMLMDPSGRLLLLQRSDKNKHSVGKWEFPGGKIEHGHDLDETLSREVEEETGLIFSEQSDSSIMVDKILPDGRYAGVLELSLYSLARVTEGVVDLSDEHSAFAWEYPSESLEYDLTTESREAIIKLGKFSLESASKPLM